MAGMAGGNDGLIVESDAQHSLVDDALAKLCVLTDVILDVASIWTGRLHACLTPDDGRCRTT